jgi:hypothetical protein
MLLLAAFIVQLAVAGLTAAADPIPADGGIVLDAGPAGSFKLEYPELWGADGKVVHKLVEQHEMAATADLKYDGGGEIRITVKPGGQIDLAITGMPRDVKTMMFQCLIGIDYGGGSFAFDFDKAAPFPRDKPKAPKLYQGHATSLTLHSVDGKAVKFSMPEFTYFDLQDNREWNWSTYIWHAFVPVSSEQTNYSLGMAELSPADGNAGKAAVHARIDEFGQPIGDVFPDKVKSLEELKSDVKSEQHYFAGLTPPQRDQYGGLPGSAALLGLNKTGYFHCEKKGERWSLVDPLGNLFFHLGVCTCLPADDYTYIGGRKEIYQWLPERAGAFASVYLPDQQDVLSFHLANQVKKYGEPYSAENYAARMIARLQKWGFNSTGPYAPVTQAERAANFPYTLGLPLGPWDAHPVKRIPGITGTWDPFDDSNREAVEFNFSHDLPGRARDPLLIGYFMSNEPIYEDIPKVVPQLDGTFACKRHLVQMLREKYSTIEKFDSVWSTSAASFDALNDIGIPVHTAAAAADVQAFTDLFFEATYKLVSETARKYDPNHMLIGNRFQSGTINNEHLVRIAGKYLDVLSFNYYTYGIDKDFLNRIHGWCGLPMFLSEFYYDSPHESGLPGGGKDLNTQEERGLAYRNYVEQSASLGFVLGIEWFTLVDQSVTGRWFQKYNGENGNSGLIAVTDRPWKKMLAPMMETNYTIYDLLLDRRPPYAFKDARFASAGLSRHSLSIPRAAGIIRMDGTAAGFPEHPPN